MPEEHTTTARPNRRLPREPKQERSRARVERLIEAADRVLADEGFQALTVRRIAEVAEVPVGSIYQFFPDKHAIVDVLSRRYLEQFTTTMDELVAEAASQRWDDPVGIVIDTFVAHYRANPGFRAVWLDRHLTPELVRADERNELLLADRLRLLLLAQTAVADNDELIRRCRVAVYFGGSLLRRAFRLDPAGDPALIEEIKRIERLYIRDMGG